MLIYSAILYQSLIGQTDKRFVSHIELNDFLFGQTKINNIKVMGVFKLWFSGHDSVSVSHGHIQPRDFRHGLKPSAVLFYNVL